MTFTSETCRLTRRSFVGTTFAALAAGAGLPSRAAAIRPNIRVGILSDIHVSSTARAGWFEKALRYFDSVKVDAVLITGDLTTWNKLPEFEAVAATWFKVFPSDRRSDGVHVERLFLTGNHDVDGWAYGGARFKSRAEAEPTSFFFHREDFWKRIFHEKYEPIMVKEVKGYTFILRNWLSRLVSERYEMAKGLVDETSPLPEVLTHLGNRLKSNRPFFYAQHEPMLNTVNSPWLFRGLRFGNDHDDGFAGKCLARYPNCCVFTGHTHYSLTDEQSIWQGAFTAVNCSCACGYAFTYPGRENGFASADNHRNPPFEMARFNHESVRQGMVMDVFDDRIVFIRREFTYDQALGADWVVPLFDGCTVPPHGIPKYDVKARASAAKPPTFAPDAKVLVEELAEGFRRTADGRGELDRKNPHPQIVVRFPSITTATSASRSFDFAVRCEMRIADIVQTVQERRVFSPNAFQAETRDTEPCSCHFPKSELPRKRDLRFVVRPFDCWGNAGPEIASAWRKLV